MSSPAELISATGDLPPLRDRLDQLERRCAELWSDEPGAHGDREAVDGRLSELDHRIVALMLRSLGGHDERALAIETARCEQDLERLAARWSTSRAA